MSELKNDKKTSASILTGTGLALLCTTCCALPIVLITLGLGGAMASLVSIFPWLIPLSKYKAITFSLTFLILGYSWFQVKCVTQCDVADAKRLKWQKRMLWVATIILLISVFAAYGYLPLINLFENNN